VKIAQFTGRARRGQWQSGLEAAILRFCWGRWRWAVATGGSPVVFPCQTATGRPPVATP